MWTEIEQGGKLADIYLTQIITYFLADFGYTINRVHLKKCYSLGIAEDIC